MRWFALPLQNKIRVQKYKKNGGSFASLCQIKIFTAKTGPYLR